VFTEGFERVWLSDVYDAITFMSIYW
jgi:hypothetical protein